MYEPRDILQQALEIIDEEKNESLPEGQLRLQIKDTLSQLQNFMKTLGCEDVWNKRLNSTVKFEIYSEVFIISTRIYYCLVGVM